MRLRQLVLACGLASLIASPLASALGLGEVKLNSTLNQPLSAEIQLLDTRDLTAEQILVSLASPADFERNGVDRLYFYTEFKFDVDLESPSGPVVRVTSRNPVREPYLNFLVEARWTAGRLLREYTLLMDLPTYDDERTAAPVSAPRATPDVPVERQTTQGRVTRPATTTTDEAPVRRERITATAGDGEYVIKPNDTLWEIALAVRPDNSVSVHQAMVALYEANPEAFINGNISRLKEGKVLRIPDATQMSSISKSEAANQFVQLESGMGAQLTASSRSSGDSSASSELSGRVTLAASNARNTSATGQGSGADDGRGKALESELASTLEELDRVKSENSELTSRVQDLESQIQTMEKMLQVSDEKMRSLQVSAEKTNQEVKADAAKPEVETTQPVVEETASEASVSSAAEVKPETKPVEQAAKPKPAPKPAPVPEPTLVDQLIANAPWIGIGVALIGGLIGFGVYRRRKQAQAEQEQLDTDMSSDEPLNFDTSMDDQDHFDQVEPEVPQDNLDLDSDLDDDVNPADKADIYIAYGQLDKAEHLLLKGLDKDPRSTDIQMKLLEVYSQQRDVSKFDKYYAALIPVAAPALLSRASELRSHIPGAGDFDMPDLAPDFSDEPAVKAQQVASLDDLELDLDDELTLEEPKSKLLEPSAPEQDDDFSIELDLTEDVDAQDTVMRGSPEPELNLDDGLGEELALDFDLDADDKSDETLDLDFDLESKADDIGDITAALDDMDDDQLPDDIQMPLSVEKEPSLSPVKSVSQDLELADDDFNLDLDSDTVDLAALDSEMSSLDTDFALDDDLTEESVDLDTSDLDSELSLDDGLDDLVLEQEDTDLSLDDLDSELELDQTDSEFDDEEVSLDADDDLSFDLEEEPVAQADQDDDLGSLDTSLDQETLPEELPEELATDEPMNEDALFEQALSDIDDHDVALTEFDQPADQDDTDSDDLDFLAEADEAATKLDLARAYIDMGDMAGARDILSEVVSEGTSEQRQEAEDLLSRIDA